MWRRNLGILRSIRVQCFWLYSTLYGLVDHNINPAKQKEDHQIIRLSGASTWLKTWPGVVAYNPGPEIDRRIPVLAVDLTYRRDSERTTDIHVASSSSFCPSGSSLAMKTIRRSNEGWIVWWMGVLSCWSWWWYSTRQLNHVDCRSATRLWSGSPRCGRGGLW